MIQEISSKSWNIPLIGEIVTKFRKKFHQRKFMHILAEYEPKQATWFDLEIKYSGIGRADFSIPPAIAKGPVEIVYHRNGQYSIEMTVVELIAPEGNDEPDDFLMAIGWEMEKCERLEVEWIMAYSLLLVLSRARLVAITK